MESEEVEVLGSERRRDRQGRMVVDAAERRRLLEQYDRSGQSQQDFAREHGINYNTLVNWLYVRRKRKGRKEESGQRMRFEELSLEGPAKGAGAELTIRLPNGVVFEIRNEAGLGLALSALQWLETGKRCSG